MIIELNGLAIEIIKKPIKNMTLRIYPPDGRVKVSAPLHFKELLIKRFLMEKSEWIDRQRVRIKEHATEQDLILKTGSALFFKGQRCTLVLNEHNGPSHVHYGEGLITCYIPPNAAQEHTNCLLERWYRAEIESMLPAMLSHWQSIIGVRVAEWGIKKMKTRWGSCNTRAHRIWLNLNLIKKPVGCLEYVLVHELIHLLEPSHNQRFYQFMDHYMPQWREYDFLLEGKTRRKGL